MEKNDEGRSVECRVGEGGRKTKKTKERKRKKERKSEKSISVDIIIGFRYENAFFVLVFETSSPSMAMGAKAKLFFLFFYSEGRRMGSPLS